MLPPSEIAKIFHTLDNTKVQYTLEGRTEWSPYFCMREQHYLIQLRSYTTPGQTKMFTPLILVAALVFSLLYGEPIGMYQIAGVLAVTLSLL